MTALITGASRGIGKAIALELASLGYDLAMPGRDLAQLGKTAEEAEKRGVRTLCIEADLTDSTACPMIAGSFTEASPELWDKVFAVNAKAPFFLSQAALPYLKKSVKPTVINISSVVGFKGYANQSVYASSKHALAGFTQVFAKEVQPFGIRVHLISPGGVATEMVKQMRPDIKADELIQPEEIAEIVRFILTRKGKGTIDEFYIRRFSGLAFD